MVKDRLLDSDASVEVVIGLDIEYGHTKNTSRLDHPHLSAANTSSLTLYILPSPLYSLLSPSYPEAHAP
ncbi:hypothetical protein BS50DRAFT_580311 [Corynespora cassiicola Philippines]|uniref:Uncharacterized protein n=1 Tax=Corynespora cassiicola Philippines TaxID=1448308 RepID=A0A2T2N0P5_CORCC|nr:hypothetical protein BS50DRAFT_580311 [Corynespora cassiicola Philippines]